MMQWNESISANHKDLDSQHKVLLSIIEDLSHAVKSKSSEFTTLLDILSELDTYVLQHFSFEEKLMDKFNYPEKEAHIAEHNVFRKKLEETDIYKIKEEDRIPLLEILLDFIFNWIEQHVRKTDAVLGTYMSNHPKVMRL